jgi:hypothetical protein
MVSTPAANARSRAAITGAAGLPASSPGAGRGDAGNGVSHVELLFVLEGLTLCLNRCSVSPLRFQADASPSVVPRRSSAATTLFRPRAQCSELAG